VFEQMGITSTFCPLFSLFFSNLFLFRGLIGLGSCGSDPLRLARRIISFPLVPQPVNYRYANQERVTLPALYTFAQACSYRGPVVRIVSPMVFPTMQHETRRPAPPFFEVAVVIRHILAFIAQLVQLLSLFSSPYTSKCFGGFNHASAVNPYADHRYRFFPDAVLGAPHIPLFFIVVF